MCRSQAFNWQLKHIKSSWTGEDANIKTFISQVKTIQDKKQQTKWEQRHSNQLKKMDV
jgi:hypothetical protein